MKRKAYGRDFGLSSRMFLTMFTLGLLYIVFFVVLVNILNVGIFAVILIIGWLIGRALHLSLLFPIGMLIGLGISIAFIIYRYGKQGAAVSRAPRKETTGDR